MAFAIRFSTILYASFWTLVGAPLAASPQEIAELPDAVASYQAGDIEGALAQWEAACEAANPRGCYHAAVVYRDGEIAEPDGPRADVLFEKACEGGFGYACFNLGNNSYGRSQLEYFEKGCAVLDIGSCARLGGAYRDGANVEKDINKAIDYLTKSCLVPDMRSGQACFELASIYDAHITNLIDDPGLANFWLDVGCARNHPESCQNLAWHYAHGFGLQLDFVMKRGPVPTCL